MLGVKLTSVIFYPLKKTQQKLSFGCSLLLETTFYSFLVSCYYTVEEQQQWCGTARALWPPIVCVTTELHCVLNLWVRYLWLWSGHLLQLEQLSSPSNVMLNMPNTRGGKEKSIRHSIAIFCVALYTHTIPECRVSILYFEVIRAIILE